MIKKYEWLKDTKISHRGLHNLKEKIIENSVEAFMRSIEYKYAIELDIHLLADNEIVVYHDYNLERLTGQNKIIEKCDCNEVKKMNLLNTKSKIPLLKEVLNLVDGKVPLLIEIKKKGNDFVLEKEFFKIIKNYSGLYAVQSFDFNSIRWMRKNEPDTIRGQLIGNYKEYKNYLKFLIDKLILNNFNKPDFIGCNIKHIPTWVINYVKKSNLYLLGWTAKDIIQYKRAIGICDNVIFENFIL